MMLSCRWIAILFATVAGIASAAELVPPDFNRQSGPAPTGFVAALTNLNTSGATFYTLDGSDPRTPVGTVSTNAFGYRLPFTINRTTTVSARALLDDTWSDLRRATYIMSNDYSKIIISEVMYQPPGTNTLQERNREFVELKNTGLETLDLSGVNFRGFFFPTGATIGPGEFRVLVRNSNEFQAVHPGVRVDGTYLTYLLNDDSTLYLNHASGGVLFSMSYGTFGPWPTTPDDHGVTQLGFSLVPVDPKHLPDPHHYRSWRASTFEGGSPGMDDPPDARLPIHVNELLARPDGVNYPFEAVEFYNPNPTDVDIGSWFLTDSRPRPKQFHIPPNTIEPARGFLTLDERLLDANPTNRVAFGTYESVYLYSANSNRNLTGLSHGYNFLETQSGVSLGRVVNSLGHEFFFPQRAQSIGATNAGPTIGPLMISEVMYHPLPGEPQYIEIVNISQEPVPLYDVQEPWVWWEIFLSVWETLPTNMSLPPGGMIIKASEDPEQFRARYNIPTNVIIDGGLHVFPEFVPTHLSLYRPSGWTTFPGEGNIPRDVPVDEVFFRHHHPWPAVANGSGASLERVNLLAFGNEPLNWRARPGMRSPGRLATNWPPLVNAGGTTFATYSRGTLLRGYVEDDGLLLSPGKVTSSWSLIAGSAVIANSNSLHAAAFFNETGTNVFLLRASDGDLEATDQRTVIVLPDSYPNWRLVHFSTNELANPNVSGHAADPDLDGISNIAEYAYGSDPRVAGAPPPLHVQIVDGHLTATIRKAVAAHDVIFHAESSPHLTGPWTDLNIQTELRPTFDLRFQNLVFRDLTPSGAQRFMRWHIAPSEN